MPEGSNQEPWRRFIMYLAPTDAGYMHATLERAIADAVARPHAIVDAPAICAVLLQESGLRHTDRQGRIVKGDGGRAIGIGQIHRKPWEKYYSFSPEFYEWRAVRLDDLYDNVAVCALIIARGGWQADDTESQLHAYAYYNSGKDWEHCGERARDYARSVAALAEKIAGYKGQGTGDSNPEHPDGKDHREDGDGE